MTRTTMARSRALLLLSIILLPVSLVTAIEQGAQLSVQGTATQRVNDRELPAARQDERITVAGSGFVPGERVGLWLTWPTGAVYGLATSADTADASGSLTAEIELSAALPTGVHHLSARGQDSGRGASAALVVLPGRGPLPTAGTQLNIAPRVARQLETVELLGSGFGGAEPIALWLTLPDGSVVGLERLATQADGTLRRSLTLPGFLPVGRSVVTVSGVASGNTAVHELVVAYGNGLGVPGARLAVDLGATVQRTVLAVSAVGFAPGESVSFWQTLPNGAVLDRGAQRAGADGTLAFTIELDETLPVGTHYLSYHSDASDQASFARFMIGPAPE